VDGRLSPTPFDDVIDHPADGQDPAAPLGRRKRRRGDRVAGGGDGGQVGLDVALPVQPGQRRQRRVGVRDEPGELPEPAVDVVDRGRGPCAGGAF